jgi:hypothetical protein
MLLMLADGAQAVVPDRLQVEFARYFLRGEYLRVHTNDQHLFVMAAVEYADAPAFRQAARGAPQEIMIEFLARWLFETEYLAARWIDALHHGADGAVLAGGVHGLEHEQHSVPVAGGEHALQLLEGIRRPFTVLALVRVLGRQRRGAGLADAERTVKRHEIL